ncbi:MAG: M42 family peptidase, partial [Oscillospiraceae bacterium]
KSIISSSALDDLAGCACLIDVAKKLNNKKLNLNVCIALSVQEETGASGSKIATFKINPTQAIAVDVSFAKTPDSPSYKCGNLSQGTMIGYAPILNRDMSEKLKNLAIENKIDYQIEIMSSRTGTNCDEIAISQNGVQTALLSIPQKYMHTAIEVVDIKDIICTSNLITQYILSK